MRAALLAYAGLAIFAAATLRGRLLILSLIILGGIAAKTILHHLREKE